MVPFVSIIVVNYNGRKLLCECLSSLQQLDYPRHRLEVIVVDNASTDDSVAYLRSDFPWVLVLPLTANLGFAGGNNAGFAIARGEWLALVNSDASAEREWLRESIHIGQSAPDIGGVAGHLVFRNQPNIVNSTGLELYRDGRAGDRDLRKNEYDVDRRASEVFGGCGAALLLRREMVRQLGGFDADLFLYYEDLDLCWRARKLGWRIVYAPTARVRHEFGGSVGVASPLQSRFVERNRAIVNLKHAPIWLATATTLALVARLGRTVYRSMIRADVSRQHVGGMVRAAIDVAMRLPQLVVGRFARQNTDLIYRRWSRPSPR